MSFMDRIKEVATVALEAGKLDLYQKVLDLMAQARELEEENAGLRAKLSAIDDRKRITALLTHHRSAYWKREDGKVDGPFCTNCWDADARLIRLQRTATSFPWPSCPQCKVQIGHTGPPPEPGAVQVTGTPPEASRTAVVRR